MPDISNFFSNEEQSKIVDAIKLAELNTSGEIRLHLENRCNRQSKER